jgi:hypothetical protein
MNWRLGRDGRRIAKESGKFNSALPAQAKSEAGLHPWVYDTVQVK